MVLCLSLEYGYVQVKQTNRKQDSLNYLTEKPKSLPVNHLRQLKQCISVISFLCYNFWCICIPTKVFHTNIQTSFASEGEQIR